MKLRNKKTGELVKVFKIGLVWNKYGMPADIGQYKNLAELNEEWEDAEDINAPSTPLIKDDKIRKAVRAWAEVNGIYGVVIVSKYQLVALHKPCSIEFYGEIYPDYEHNEEHTIYELCGAPEPLEPTFVDLDERIKEKEEE